MSMFIDSTVPAGLHRCLTCKRTIFRSCSLGKYLWACALRSSSWSSLCAHISITTSSRLSKGIPVIMESSAPSSAWSNSAGVHGNCGAREFLAPYSRRVCRELNATERSLEDGILCSMTTTCCQFSDQRLGSQSRCTCSRAVNGAREPMYSEKVISRRKAAGKQV